MADSIGLNPSTAILRPLGDEIKTALETGGSITTPTALQGFTWVSGRQVFPEAFGATGDGTDPALSSVYGSLAAAQVDFPHATALTDSLNWAAIQAALDDAPVGAEVALSGSGVYKINQGLHISSNGILNGRGALVENTRTSGFLGDASNGSCIAGGGYFGNENDPWVGNLSVAQGGEGNGGIYGETFYELMGSAADDPLTIYAGSSWISTEFTGPLGATDATSDFTVGDGVFIRCAAYDEGWIASLNPSANKEIPLKSEINVVEEVDTVGKQVRLRWPLADSYVAAFIAISSGTQILSGDIYRPATLIQDAVIRDIRLRSAVAQIGGNGAFNEGGGWVGCNFENINIERSTYGLFANAMARCTWRNTKVRYAVGNELAYYCHDNEFDGLHLVGDAGPALTAGNGLALTEGASRNRFRGLRIDHPFATFSLSQSFGRDNEFQGVVHAEAATNTAPIRVMALEETADYWPENCTLDLQVYAGHDPTLRPTSFVRVRGVNNTVNLRAIGEARYASAVVLHSALRLSTGNTITAHNVDIDGGTPESSYVAEVHSVAPDGVLTSLALVNSAWVPELNTLRQIGGIQQMKNVHETKGTTINNTSLEVIREVDLLKYVFGNNTKIRVSIRGRTDGTNGNKFVYLYAFGGARISKTLAAADEKRFELTMELGGPEPPYAVTAGTVQDAHVQKRGILRLLIDGVMETESTFDYTGNTDSADLTLQFQARVANASDTIRLDEWRVEVTGDEWSPIRWDLAKVAYSLTNPGSVPP